MKNFTFYCRVCGQGTMLRLDEEKVAAWQRGALAQVVFPELTADVRELMISNTCGKCFEEMFGKEAEI